MPNFSRGQYYYDTKTRQKHQKKKLQIDIPFKHRCKNSQQNTRKLNSTAYDNIIKHDQVGFIPEVKNWFNIGKSMQYSQDNFNKHRKDI